MERKNIYLASKPRYEILDGLRGVAAVLVVAYHLLETSMKGVLTILSTTAIWLWISSSYCRETLRPARP